MDCTATIVVKSFYCDAGGAICRFYTLLPWWIKRTLGAYAKGVVSFECSVVRPQAKYRAKLGIWLLYTSGFARCFGWGQPTLQFGSTVWLGTAMI